MRNTPEDVAQQLVDGISLLPRHVQEDMERRLFELLDGFPEPLSESITVVDNERGPSLSPSETLPDSTKNTARQHEHLRSTVVQSSEHGRHLDPSIIVSSPDAWVRCGNDKELSHRVDLFPSPTSAVSLDADVSASIATVVNEGDIQEESKADGSSGLDDPFPRTVRGSRATLDSKDVQATHVTNPGELQSKGKKTAAAEVSGFSDSTHSRLLKPSNAYASDSAPLPVDGSPNRRVEHLAEAGTYVPGLRRNVGASRVVPTMRNDKYHLPYIYGNVPFAFPHPPEAQGGSSQAYSGRTPLPYPPVPMPYPGPPIVLPPGYGNLPIPTQGTSSTAEVPVRKPFGNSQRVNVDVTEAPRASEAGPSRAGRKGAKKAARKEAVTYVCELPDCPLPGKQFYDKRELLRHQTQTKAHSKGRFPCPMCEGTFGRKDAVTRHTKKFHKHSEVVPEP